MSIQKEITRLQTAKTTISEKLVDFGVANADDKLDALATALGNISNKGKATKTLDAQNTSYTIEAGYHNGEGVVSINAIEKTVQSGETQKAIDAEDGSVFKKIIVQPIPSNYKNITGTDVTTADVLSGVIFIDKDGNKTSGGMSNNGAVNKTLDLSKGSTDQYTNNEYTVPQGYHNGSGKVKVVFEDPITLTPDRNKHDIVPNAGKVLSTVTVQPIPSNLQDVSSVNATAGAVLVDNFFVDKNGTLIEGTIPVYEDQTITLSLSKTSESLHGKYYETSTVNIVTEEEREVTPDKTGFTVSPTKDQYNRDRVLSTVKVLPIPDKYQDVSGVTAVAANVLDNTFFVTKSGVLTEGTMPSYGIVERTINWTDLSQAPYYEGTFQGYVTDVSVGVNTSTLETALAEI